MLKPDNKLIALIALVSVVVITIIVFALVPTIHYIQQGNRDAYNLRSYLEKKYARSVNAHTAAKQIEKTRDEVTSFEDSIYHQGNELALITFFEELATKHTLSQKISATNLDHIVDNTITFSATLSGNYQDTLAYLAELEEAPYFITLKRVQLAPLTDRAMTDPSKVNLTIEVELYAAP